MVKQLNPADLTHLNEQFHKIDTDQTGLISYEELADAVKDLHLDLPAMQIEEIIKEVDYHGDGKINYTEFLVATI